MNGSLIMLSLILVLALQTVFALAASKDGLFISSFNIRKFGISKVSDENNLKIITNIVLRYDLVFIQEIVDKTEEAIDILLEKVNEKSGDKYELTLSNKVGLEQYAYMYKKSKLQVLKQKEYHDIKDVFARDPYLVVFTSLSTSILTKFVVIGVHTNPKNARYEIGNLTKVYSYVKRWGDTDAIMMGDLNAGCSYFPNVAKKINPLYQQKTYNWLIPDSMDTTANLNTECAYDRFVLAGRDMKKSIVANSAGIFNFSKVYELSYSATLNVSDHYPIEMRLK